MDRHQKKLRHSARFFCRERTTLQAGLPGGWCAAHERGAMSEIISCPSCQRKVQVPEALAGQDVQCPTCGATFVAQLPGMSPSPPASEPWAAPSEQPDSWRDRPSGRRSPPYNDRGEVGRYPEDEDEPYGRHRQRDLIPHRGALILTLGILAIFLCSPLGIFAWVMGNTDMAQIRAGRMDPDGEGLTQAGRIIGMITTGILLLQLCLCGLYFVAVGSAFNRM
jgi:hypothetical protein